MSETDSRSIKGALADAEKALDGGRYFEAERSALSALEAARNKQDFAAMIAAVPTLRVARRQRFDAAMAAANGRVRRLEAKIEEDDVVEPGCYLVEPPLVGADARNLRLAALEQEVPVVAVCREPLTQMKLRPIVAIGRITVRARVLPAEDDANPDLDWLLAALNELGETAIDSIDPGAEPLKQVDAVLDRLDSIPDHERLHEVLVELCRVASEPPDAN